MTFFNILKTLSVKCSKINNVNEEIDYVVIKDDKIHQNILLDNFKIYIQSQHTVFESIHR